MAQDQLREFFREKKQRANPDGADWTIRRDDWIKAVERLYRTIEEYLKEANAEVEIRRADKVVTESAIGEYHVPELILQVGDEQVVFSPKGVRTLGAGGRIDVYGDRGDATIVRQQDKDLGDHWSLVLARTPALRTEPLTADSLAEMLRGIMRP